MIGDGKSLRITHTGSAALPSSSSALLLSDVLCVPLMKQNLILVSKLCSSNNVSIEFLPFSFVVKDLLTGAHLAEGVNKDGVYEWPNYAPIKSLSDSSYLAFATIKTNFQDWHNRLGHPSLKILSQIIRSFKLPLSSPSPNQFSCHSCKCNKMHKLPFSASSLTSNSPLELIYSDVWGASPVASHDGFLYYLLFVDHYTKYMWLFPIKQKSDVSIIFPKFKLVVEKYFQRPIISFYSDNGGEFIKLRHFFEQTGISHFFTPPHTPEHNGIAERRHQHIVQTGLTLLSQASLPLKFWSHAFLTATYLINRMPSPTLQMESPFQKLFGNAPNYSKLRVFGCLCYPWLKPYAPNKLHPRSRSCVFLGYSSSHFVD